MLVILFRQHKREIYSRQRQPLVKICYVEFSRTNKVSTKNAKIITTILF